MAELLRHYNDLYNDYTDNFEIHRRETFFSAWECSAVGCVLYLVVIKLLTVFMEDRKPYVFKTFTAIHNAFLCLLSFSMFVGLVNAMYQIYVKHGWSAVTCDENSEFVLKGKLVFWSYIFFLSKVYEWVDTYLLVVKKKPIIFLHVYHHVTTLWICWGQIDTNSFNFWEPVVFNVLIHTFMYYYYAARTLGYDVWWKKYLTQAQMVQFIVALICTATKGYQVYYGGCNGSIRAWFFGQFVIITFLLLFLQFYFRTYKKAPASSKKGTTKSPASGRVTRSKKAE